MSGRAGVQVWLVDMTAAQGLPVCLDEGEQERLQRLHRADDRARAVTAWSLRRRALSSLHPEIPPAGWRFVAGRFGKPVNAPAFAGLDLHHNLAHAGRYVAFVAAHGMPCGIDVERLPSSLDGMELALHPGERAVMRQAADPRLLFLRLWIAKEAVVKLWGTGMQMPPNAVCVDLDAMSVSAERSGASPALSGWGLPPCRVLLSGLQEDHHLAVAAPQNATHWPPVIRQWDAASQTFVEEE